jgi:hypothetical protein
VSKPAVVPVKPGNGREPRPKNRPKTWKLLKAAELRPLDPGVAQNASRLRRLAKQGYLRRGLLDGVEVFFRTEKPYVRPDVDDGPVFDAEKHRRRFQE